MVAGLTAYLHRDGIFDFVFGKRQKWEETKVGRDKSGKRHIGKRQAWEEIGVGERQSGKRASLHAKGTLCNFNQYIIISLLRIRCPLIYLALKGHKKVATNNTILTDEIMEHGVFCVRRWDAVVGIDNAKLGRVLKGMFIKTQQVQHAAQRLQITQYQHSLYTGRF